MSGMTVGEMIDRIVAFKKGPPVDGELLRHVDPECADALNAYWNAFGPHGSHPSDLSINFLFNEVERRLTVQP